MISLLPNQRLEVVPGSAIALKFQAVTSEILDYNETRERIATVTGYETSTSAAARVLAPVVTGGTRVVQSFVVAPVNSALSTTLTLQIVTVPTPLVGVTQVETVQTLDVITLAAGYVLLAEGGDAGWSVRIPAASTVIPAPGSNGQFLAIVSGAATWTDTKTTRLTLALGTTTDYLPLSVTGSINNYFEQNIQNTSAGTGASSDFVATADTGSETTKYIDFGINSSGWTGSTWGAALDGYLYTSDNDLWIGTNAAGKVLRLNAGGGAAANTRATLTADGLYLGNGVATAGNGLIQLPAGTTKANAIALGTDCFIYRTGAGLLTLPGAITTGDGISTGDASLEIGGARTGDGNCYIDGHATSGSDYEFRILRLGGVNGAFTVYNTGTGTFTVQQTGAGELALATTGTARVRIGATGTLHFAGGAPVAIPTGFGTPTGVARLINFPGATATLAQTSGAMADLITLLKAYGLVAA